MELFIAFGIFIASMLTAVITGYSMILPLLVGLAAFMAVGKIRGFSLGSMAEMSKKGILDSIVVIKSDVGDRDSHGCLESIGDYNRVRILWHESYNAADIFL